MVEVTPFLPRCSQHPQATAGWACDLCQTRQCVDCAAVVAGVPACGTCGLSVSVLHGRRRLVEPFTLVWRRALAPLKTFAAVLWLTLFTCAVQLLLSLHGSAGLWFIGRLLMVGWLFYVTRRAGRGLGPFERPTWGDLISVWRGPLVRGLPVLVPVGLIAALLVDAGARALPRGAFVDVVLAIPAALVLAVALPTVTIEGEGRRWANVPNLKDVAQLITPALPWLVGLTATAFCFELLSARIAPLNADDTRLERPIAQMYALHLGVNVVCTALGLIAGQVLVTFAGELGHDSAEPLTLPWVSALPSRAWQPLAEALVAQPAVSRFTPIEVISPTVDLTRAVQQGHLDEALVIFQHGGVLLSEVPGDALVTLAQGLAARGQVSSASMVLEVLLSRPSDPNLARGHVILARLMSERLNQPDRARQLYQAVIARFPGTAAAEFAAARLDVTQAK